MFILDGKPLSPDVAFTHDGVQYPANWLRLASPEERAAIGITEEPDPTPYDQRFYWGPDLPKDHAQLVEQWVAQTRITAGTLIQPTDWMVIREQDNGTAVPESVKALREDIRLATGQKNTAIEATADTAELAAYITGNEYPIWPSDPPAAVESAAVDGLEFASNSSTTDAGLR
jgi:hypothetical protein